MKKFSLKLLILSIFIAILTLTDVGNSSFVLQTVAEKNDIQIQEAGGAVCYNGTTGTRYTTIEKALKDAEASTAAETIYVIPGKNPTITSDCTIASGDTLCLPYEGTTWDYGKPDTNLKDTFIDSSSANVTKYRVTNVSLRNSKLVVSSGGNFIIGGIFRAKGVCGLYCEVSLDSNSHIEVYGSMTNYGYIKEIDGKNPYQEEFADIENKYNNEIDKNRYIEVFSGGKFLNSLAIYNNLGASYLKGLNDNGICPVDTFDFPNTQTYLKINSGALFQSQAKVLVTSSASNVSVNETMTVVSTKSFSTANNIKPLFLLESGYLSIENCPTNVLYSNANSKTIINIAGQMDIGYLYINLSAAEINTSKMYLPISYKFSINVISNGILTSDYKIKFLAGSKILIEKGSTAKLNSDTILYEYDTLNDISTSYPTNLSDAVFINNGDVILGSNSHIGGHISTNSSDGTAKIDTRNLTENNLSATSNEGTINSSITMKATGDFYIPESNSIEKKKIASGQLIHSCSDGNKAWANGYINTYTLTINVINPNNYPYPAAAFKAYKYDSAGSNESMLSSEGKFETTPNIYEYLIEPNSKFKVISLARAESNTFTNQSNSNYTFTSGQLFAMVGDIELTITCGEGYEIWFNSSGQSGNGGSTKEIMECPTSNGTFETICLGGASGGQEKVIIGKNQYFKYKYTKGTGTASQKGYYKFDGHTSITESIDGATKVGSLPGTSNAILADKEYTILAYMESCFTSGTEILLSDGTSKKIEEINKGDYVMTWNFFTGTYEPQKVAFIVDHGFDKYKTLKLNFSNGESIKIIGDHGIFDYDLNKYVYITVDNYTEYINHQFVTYSDTGTYKLSTLISGEVKEEMTYSYSLTTEYNYNVIANNLFTAPPPENLYNWIEMSGKLQYDVEKFNEDVETYGLYDYSVFEPYGISYETYVTFNGAYLKAPVEKGIFTFEYIIEQFNLYREWIE